MQKCLLKVTVVAMRPDRFLGYSCKPAMSREPGGTAPQIHPVSFIKTVVINIRNHIEIVDLPRIAIFIG
jgi:hypothetical protein